MKRIPYYTVEDKSHHVNKLTEILDELREEDLNFIHLQNFEVIKDVEDNIEEVLSSKPKIIFLDMEMAYDDDNIVGIEKNAGVRLLQFIGRYKKNRSNVSLPFKIIVLTKHKEYGLKVLNSYGFIVGAYILKLGFKEELKEDIHEAVQKCLDQLTLERRHRANRTNFNNIKKELVESNLNTNRIHYECNISKHILNSEGQYESLSALAKNAKINCYFKPEDVLMIVVEDKYTRYILTKKARKKYAFLTDGDLLTKTALKEIKNALHDKGFTQFFGIKDNCLINRDYFISASSDMKQAILCDSSTEEFDYHVKNISIKC